MIIAEPPCYALHLWKDGQLITHFDTAEDHEILARYTTQLQLLVQTLIAEKREAGAAMAAGGAAE